MHILSIVFAVALLGLGDAADIDRLSLPMGAYLRRSEVPVYSKPLAFVDYEIFRLRGEGSPVSVWESTDRWLRITPPGFSPEGWVKGEHLRLDPATSASEHSPYLAAIQMQRQAEIERTTPTACAVVLHGDTRYYSSPSVGSPAGSSWHRYDEATILTVFQQRDGFYEVRGNRSGERLQWLQADSVELAKPFASGDEPCIRYFDIEKHPRYTLIASSAYRNGPSAKLPPVAFYKEGETVTVLGEYAGGWLSTISGTMGSVWFPANDAVPTDQVEQQSAPSSVSFPVSAFTTATNLRLRAGPAGDAAILSILLAADSYIIVYEERAGWYRITPDNFAPAAWVSAQYVRLAREQGLAPQSISYYLADLQPPAPQSPPTASRPFFRAPLFEGPLGFLFRPWTWASAFMILFPFLLGLSAWRALRDYELSKAADYAFWIIGTGTLAAIMALAVSFNMKIVIPAVLVVLVFGVPSALYPFYWLWIYLQVRTPEGLKLKIWRRSTVSEEKKDKILKPEVVSSLSKIENTDIAKRDGAPRLHANLEIEPKPLSRIPIINTLNRAAYKSQAETVRSVTDLLNANEELGQAAARLDRLQNVAKRDKQTLAHQIEEEEEKHHTRLLEEKVQQARLRAQIAGYDGGNASQQSGQPRRSLEDELRAAVARDLEAETARMKILDEKRHECEEKVRRGEMTPDDMEHHLSMMKASLNRHAAKRQ